jgi:hypothetical protein
MVILRDAGSRCGGRSDTLEDRVGCRPRDVFGYRHPFKQRQKPRRDLAAREDTCFHHDRQIPNGTGSQVLGKRLQPRPATPADMGVTWRPRQPRSVDRKRERNVACDKQHGLGACAGTDARGVRVPLNLQAGRKLIATTDVTSPVAKATKSLVGRPVFKLWNESRTNRARIADSTIVRIRSRRHVVAPSGRTTTSCKWRRIAYRGRAAIR